MDIKDKKLLAEYYKRRLYGGRTKLARAVDFIALRAALLITAYLWFAAKLPNLTLRVILSGTVVGLLCVAAELYKSIRLDRFREKERQRIREAHAQEQLLLCTPRAYADMVRAYAQAHAADYPGGCLVYPLQRSESLGVDALLSVYRLARQRDCARVALFSPAVMSHEARKLMRRTDIDVALQGPAVFFRMARENGIVLDDAGVDENILADMRREKQARKEKAAPFLPDRIKRYVLAALGLFVASFFVRYTLYYRLMAALCLSFGVTALWVSKAGSLARHGYDEK